MTFDQPDGSVSQTIATAVEAVRESGLPHETTSVSTTIEGEWDEATLAVRQCIDVVAKRSPRISLVMKTDICLGYTGQITAKVERISEILENG